MVEYRSIGVPSGADIRGRALEALIAAVILLELLDSAAYRWHRAARAVAGWEDRIGHRQRMARYDAARRSLRHRMLTERGGARRITRRG